tara:strand:+ start:2688 stop:3635 length:948 start_codon:yes stop_codon:yes gene_type:complete
MNEQTPSRALSTMRAGASALLPIYPTTFEEVARLARMICIAGMIKPLKIGFGDNATMEDSNATEARATMIIMQGMELGLPPMQSAQLIAMINGRMTVHSEGVPGILLSKGFKIEQSWSGKELADEWKAICKLTRPDGEFVISEFSVKDAKQADLWDQSPTKTSYGKTKPNDSAWFRYPKRMLWARALGFAAKDKAADAMRGLMVREEVEDMLRSGQVVDITPMPSIATTASQGAAPEIPDVPDIPSPATQEAAPMDDDTLSEDQQAALIEKIRDDLSLCKTHEERSEVAESYFDILDRLNDALRRKAESLLQGVP